MPRCTADQEPGIAVTGSSEVLETVGIDRHRVLDENAVTAPVILKQQARAPVGGGRLVACACAYTGAWAGIFIDRTAVPLELDGR